MQINDHDFSSADVDILEAVTKKDILQKKDVTIIP
jgi:hypothetical protein